MLEVKNLTKKYPKFNLENVNLSLPKGQIMGFIGKNGAGKRVLLRSLKIKLALSELQIS